VTNPHQQSLRWYVLWGVLLLSFTAFVERLTTSVVAPKLISDVGLTQTSVGWLFAAFAAGYTVCQFPAAVIGLRFGARKVLSIAALCAATALLAAAVASAVAGVASLLVILLGTQLLMGVCQAPLYPVSSGALQAWFPPRQWAWVQGLVVTSLGLGAGVTPPAVAWLMVRVGWKLAMGIVAVPGLLAAIFWWRYMRDRPDGGDPSEAAEWRQTIADALALARDRNVLLLTVSYVLDNAVVYLLTFWSFLYLVQERHFSILQGGWLAGIPFVVGALGGALGGRWCDRFCDRLGPRWGARVVPLAVLPIAAVALYLTVESTNAYLAVCALTVSYSCLQMVEGPYWSTAMRIGGERTMAATGVLNTGGNLGGIVSTPVVGYLSGLHDWTMCFVLGIVCIAASAGLWLIVDAAGGKRSGERFRSDSRRAPLGDENARAFL
jgi:ACS family glucarate transporter-like MFS transporter